MTQLALAEHSGDVTTAASVLNRRPSLVRTSLLLLPAQLVIRGVEAALPIVIALLFGSTGDTDLYYLATAELSLLGALFFDLYRDSALVPILTRAASETRANVAASRSGEHVKTDEVASVVGALAGHTMLWGSLLACVAGVLVNVTMPVAGTVATSAFSRVLVWVLSSQLVLMSLRSLFAATLNAHGRYLAAVVPGALGMAAALIAVFVGWRLGFGISVVAFAMLGAELVALLPMWWAVRRTLKRPLKITLRTPPLVRRFARLVASEVMGSVVVRVNPVVDQRMATWVGIVGGGTLLRLGGDVAMAPTSLLQAVLFPALLTELAHKAVSNIQSHRHTVLRALLAVTGVLTCATVLLLELRRPLIRLLFGHGAMDAAQLEQLASVMRFQLVGLVPFGALLVLARAHVSLGNSRIMFGLGLLNVALNLSLNLAFVRVLGLGGIALSTALVQLGIAATMAVLLARFYAKQHRTIP